MSKCYCIVNPLAGGRRGHAFLRVLTALKDLGKLDAEIVEFRADTFDQQMRDARQYPCVLVAGGDGSVSSVLQRLLDTPVKIGILPLGTANDLARELGVYKLFSLSQPEVLLDYYSTAPCRPFTLWRLAYGADFGQALIFCNYVSFGFDAMAVAIFDRWRHGFGRAFSGFGCWGNRFGYLLAALRSLGAPRLRHVLVKKGNEHIELSGAPLLSLLVSNISSIMGLGISNPESSPFDVQAEVSAVSSILHYFSMLLHYRLHLPVAARLGSARAWEINGIPPGTAVQVDGDPQDDLHYDAYRLEQAGQVQMMVACL